MQDLTPRLPYIRWTYDDVGNRLTESRPSGTVTHTYDNADELTSKTDGSTSTSYSYDNDGNQLVVGSRTYGYDLAGRLSTYISGSTSVTNSYDGDGRRLAQTAGSTSTEYIWDANSALPQLAIERSGSTLIRRYHQGLDLVSMRSSGSDFYYHYDGLGSVANVSDSSGATQWTYTYEPFGVSRTTTGVIGAPNNPVQFTGEYTDAINGLYNLRARQYDSADGRFTTTDPAPNELTDPYVAAYAYVGNRPTTLIDPSGMCGWSPTEWLDCAKKGTEAVFHWGEAAFSKIGGARHYIKVATEFNTLYIEYRVAKALARSFKREAASFYRDYRAQGGGAMGFLDALNFRNPGFWFWMHEHGCRSAAATSKGKQWARECTLAAASLLDVVGTAIAPVAGARLSASGTGAALGADLNAARQGVSESVTQMIRAKAGFAARGEPLIVDNSLGVNPQRVAAALRREGYNARSVNEIFGADPKDPAIKKLAEIVNGRVLAVDRGRGFSGGFGTRVIRVDGRVRNVETIVRMLRANAA